jgi:uncharacterized membrane protein (DUF106 family)
MIELLNNLSYFWIIFLLAFIITVLTTLVYKYTTDQKKLKRVKEDLKSLREKQKKHVNNQKKFMEIQKDMMSRNTDLMKESFKPMIYTMLPLIILLSWMAGNLAFEPINPAQAFQVSIELNTQENVTLQVPEGMEIISENGVSWMIRAQTEGTYQLLFVGETFSETKDVLITTKKDYINPVQTYNSNLKQVTVGQKPVKPLGDISIFGWMPGWLGTYIILSIFLSILVRKLLRVN